MALNSAAINLSSSDNGVSTKSVEYQAMEEDWHLPEALLSGTKGMRLKGKEYLPENQMEGTRNYDARLLRTFLYGAYSDTVNKLADKPFQKPVVVQESESLPEELQQIEHNVDFTGRNLTDFARDLTEDATIYGKTHILIDYPKTGGATTLKEKKIRQPRPSFIHVTARDLIGWQVENNEDGVPELKQIRYVESSVEADGDYGDRIITRIKVWKQTEWECWEEQVSFNEEGTRDSSWVLIDSGINSLGYVPLVTAYFKREGILVSGIPLEELAWTNLEHWQSSSEQRNMLHVVRIATLFAKGFPQEQVENGITVSANGMIATENSEADLKWVEHEGRALEAGAKDLEVLQQRMEVEGLQPLIQKSSTGTATGQAITEGKSNTKIQAWVRVIEGMLVKAYVVAADWINEADSIPEDFNIDIFNDFGISARDATELSTLDTARLNGDIDHSTYIKELKRRGILSESAEAEQIQTNLDEETKNTLKNSDKNFLDDEEIEEEEEIKEEDN